MPAPGRSLLHAVRHLVRLDQAQTQTTIVERTVLAVHARGRRRAVEIGVFEGVNTALIADALAPDGELYAIDPFPAGRIGVCWGEIIARREVQRRRAESKVNFVKALSWDACLLVAGRFDFIFIDGDHSMEAIKRDWSDWSGRLEEGGVIALHDTRPPDDDPLFDWPGSTTYFESHIRYDPRFMLLEQVDRLSVLRRIGAPPAGPA